MVEINELYGFLAVVSLRLMWAWVRWCSGNVSQWWSASDWLDFDFDRRLGIGDRGFGSGIRDFDFDWLDLDRRLAGLCGFLS